MKHEPIEMVPVAGPYRLEDNGMVPVGPIGVEYVPIPTQVTGNEFVPSIDWTQQSE